MVMMVAISGALDAAADLMSACTRSGGGTVTLVTGTFEGCTRRATLVSTRPHRSAW